MSDSEDFTVTYTAVPPSPDYIPGPKVPPSPDYIPGPKEPQSPPPLDFVPEPMYPEYIPQEDEILPAEDQPLPTAASPTTDSPVYVPESDLKEEPEEDDEDLEEDPADYTANRDDDDDNEEEDKEEHPAPADYVPPVHRMTARISIWDEPSISLPPREEVNRLLSLTTPSPSPLTPLSSPLPHIPSPQFPASPPASPIRHDTIHFSSITTTYFITTFASYYLLTTGQTGPKLHYYLGRGLVLTLVLGTRLERRAEEVSYGIRDVWVDPREAVEEVALMTLEGVNARDRQTQIYQSVETLVDDSQYHYETTRLLDQEALVSREAWGRSIEVSYMIRSEILALRSVVLGQQAVISQLQVADRKSQVVTLEMLQTDYQRQVQLTKALELLKGQQTQMDEFQRQLRPAKGPVQPDAPGEAGSSS
ncbi:hypothetical protein Tco_1514149 [Tanacetum coccineum]